MIEKKDIRDLSLRELTEELEKWGEPSFRATQIFDWLYKKGAVAYDAFSDVPRSLRQKLEEIYSFRSLVLADRASSHDGTEKYLFELSDGNYIETVLIPAGKRRTVCLSTQVGCKFACVFCASGMAGFKRNLLPFEILGQVLFLRDKLRADLTNFVFMGMGEPLDNCENVFKAIRIMNDAKGLCIAARRMTISTSGVTPGLERLNDLGLQLHLSLSLHSAKDEVRSSLMPINKKYPLEDLLKTSEDYIKKTGRMISLEYILLRDLNDSAEDARRLAALAKRLRAKVNLIPYSPVCGLEFEASPKARAELFLRWLEEKDVNATLRRSKGVDIQAACGQLAGRLKGRTGS